MVKNQICGSMSKWVMKQTEERLRNLHENKHFSIIVTHATAKESCAFSSSIRCNACKTIIHLHQKDSSEKDMPYLLSNWTRHVKKCENLNSKKSIQFTIPNLLSLHASSSTLPSHENAPLDGAFQSSSFQFHMGIQLQK